MDSQKLSVTWQILLSILPILLSAIALIATFVKLRPEINSTNSQSIKTYADVTKEYAEEVRALRAEIPKIRAEYETRISEMEFSHETELRKQKDESGREIEQLKLTIAIMQRQITEMMVSEAAVKDWARRLSAQVIELNGVPVPFEKEKSS